MSPPGDEYWLPFATAIPQVAQPSHPDAVETCLAELDQNRARFVGARDAPWCSRWVGIDPRAKLGAVRANSMKLRIAAMVLGVSAAGIAPAAVAPPARAAGSLLGS